MPMDNSVFHRATTLLCLCYVLLRCARSTFTGSCPEGGWIGNKFSGTCIKIYDTTENWTSARRTCQSVDGDLVKIETNQMNRFVLGRVDMDYYWIGLNDKRTEDTYTWLDNREQTSFTNWSPRMPGNGTYEDCINFYGHNGKWNDQKCSIKRKFVCEITACKKERMYGGNCSHSCPHCAGPCFIYTGVCLNGCEIGYRGDNCETLCDNQTYGVRCSERCSPACNGTTSACDPVDGSCLLGCDAGFQGPKCDKFCDIQTYGVHCSERCSPGCYGTNDACDPVDGSCLYECEAGYRGAKCDTDTRNVEGQGSFLVPLAVVAWVCALLCLMMIILTYKVLLSNNEGNESETEPEGVNGDPPPFGGEEEFLEDPGLWEHQDPEEDHGAWEQYEPEEEDGLWEDEYLTEEMEASSV